MDEKDIIEVEAVDVSVDEAPKQEKIEKTKHDHSKSINKLGFWINLLRRPCFSLFFITITVGFIFAILSSQHEEIAFRIIMIIGLSLAGLFFLGFVLSFVLAVFMRRLKRDDPNFVDSVYIDSIY